jgi:hypothetical protein
MEKIQQRTIETPTKALNVFIPIKLWNKVDKLAKQQKKSKAMVAEEIIRFYFENQSENNKKKAN